MPSSAGLGKWARPSKSGPNQNQRSHRPRRRARVNLFHIDGTHALSLPPIKDPDPDPDPLFPSSGHKVLLLQEDGQGPPHMVPLPDVREIRRGRAADRAIPNLACQLVKQLDQPSKGATAQYLRVKDIRITPKPRVRNAKMFLRVNPDIDVPSTITVGNLARLLNVSLVRALVCLVVDSTITCTLDLLQRIMTMAGIEEQSPYDHGVRLYV